MTDRKGLAEELTKALPLLKDLETGQDCEDYAYAVGGGFQAMTFCPEAFEALRCLPRAIEVLRSHERMREALERIKDEANTVCGDWRETASMIDSICITALQETDHGNA